LVLLFLRGLNHRVTHGLIVHHQTGRAVTAIHGGADGVILRQLPQSFAGQGPVHDARSADVASFDDAHGLAEIEGAHGGCKTTGAAANHANVKLVHVFLPPLPSKDLQPRPRQNLWRAKDMPGIYRMEESSPHNRCDSGPAIPSRPIFEPCEPFQPWSCT